MYIGICNIKGILIGKCYILDINLIFIRIVYRYKSYNVIFIFEIVKKLNGKFDYE